MTREMQDFILKLSRAGAKGTFPVAVIREVLCRPGARLRPFTGCIFNVLRIRTLRNR